MFNANWQKVSSYLLFFLFGNVTNVPFHFLSLGPSLYRNSRPKYFKKSVVEKGRDEKGIEERRREGEERKKEGRDERKEGGRERTDELLDEPRLEN